MFYIRPDFFYLLDYVTKSEIFQSGERKKRKKNYTSSDETRVIFNIYQLQELSMTLQSTGRAIEGSRFGGHSLTG